VSAPAQTKIFGIRIGADPKIVAGVLIALAVVLVWYNTRSDDDTGSTNAVSPHQPTAAVAPARTPINLRSRRSQNLTDRGTLRFRAIDPTRGDVDPTLRLDLLSKVQNVQAAAVGRSLFDLGPPPLTPEETRLLKQTAAITPKRPVPIIAPPSPPVNAESAANIPLKYYGFVKSGEKNQGNVGFFLDGDDVVVGSEGELVMKKYLVVELTPSTARIEDTQLKKGQTLTVVPAAVPTP
jgi:hypothetical protein